MKITGHTLRLGDNINTDLIIPGRYLTIHDPNHLAQHCFHDTHPSFTETIKQQPILIAGKNFGCGSSREQATICLKYAGVHAIIAHSFARIFFRNAINIGLPIYEHPETIVHTKNNDSLTIDTTNGTIINHTQNKQWALPHYPPLLHNIIENTGIISYINKKK